MPVAHAQTSADLQAQIAALLAQIQALQGQLAGGGSSAPATTFTADLTLGSTGSDVTALQTWLVSKGYLTMPAGVAMGYFGNLTKSAVAKYQAAKGISPAAGYFGPKTRASVNAEAGPSTGTGSTPTGTVPQGAALSVQLASDTPASMTLGSGTAFNPALKVVLTAGSANVSVSSLTLAKSGFLANSNLNGVDVVDSKGVRHGNVITSINADNTILLTMPSDPIMVSAGTSETITVRFNLNTGDLNGTIAFGIPSAASVGANVTVMGSFPINGNAMTVVNGGNSLASSTLDVLTSTASNTLNVDPANLQEITKFRVQETASNEGMHLRSLTLYNYGNAGDADYKDVTLEDQNGTVLATAQPKGQYVTFNLASPYLIDKGLTKDLTIRAKLIGGTTKTVNFVIYNNYDVDLRGVSTGVSVIPGSGTNDTSFPLGNGFNIQTIGSGTITFNKASDSPSAATTPGAQAVVLAKYVAKPTGENMELRQVAFYVSTSSTGLALSGTVYVKVNGVTVYSTAASSISTTATATFTLSSYPILTQGVDNVITVEGSISSSATAASNYTVQDFDLIQVKRLVTLDLLDPGVTATDGNQINVSAAALAVSTLATPVANSVVTGMTGVEFATITLNAQAGGEDVKVNKIVVTHTGSTPANIANLAMYQGTNTTALPTTGSTATNAATVTFNFTNPIIVTRSTPVTLHLKGDVVGTVAASSTFHVASSTSAVTAVGYSTGNTLTNGSDITFAGSGQAQTVAAAGTLTLSLVSGSGASPSADQVTSVGTSAGTYLAFKLTSQYEAQKITKLVITASSTSATALATSTVTNIKLYEGTNSTPFAQASQFDSCTSGVCSVSFTSSDNLLAAAVPTTGVNIYVKADVSAAGTATLGDNFVFKIASATTTDITAKGALSSAAPTSVSGTPTASGITYVVPQQVLIEAVSPTSATEVGLSSGQTLGVFKVTNNGSAPVYASGTWSFANSGSATTSVTFIMYSSAQGGSSGDISVTFATSTAGTTGASSTVAFNAPGYGTSEADRTINGGSYRYYTIRSSGVAANNNTFGFSVSTLGSLTFTTKEADLGYSGNPASDSDLSDSNAGLYIDGKPSLGTVTAKT